MSKTRVSTTCRVALLATIYFLLSLLAPIQMATLKIGFQSITVVIAGVLLGPWAAFCVGALGEFLIQLLRYSFTATTLLWLIPVGLRGVVIGLAGRKIQLERHPMQFYAVCLVASVVTTLTNTPIIWLDSVLYGYYSYAIVFGAVVTRLVTGLVVAVVIATVALPLSRAVRPLVKP